MKAYSLLLLIVCIVAGACKKKEDIEIKRVPAVLQQMLPYTNGQTIRYATTSGPTITATVSSVSGFTEKSSCATCDPYVKEAYISYQLTVGTRPFVTLSIDIRPIIFMNIFSPTDNYQVGSGFDFLTVEGAAQPVCNGPRQTCLSSLSLNGKTYSNVLEVISGATAAHQLTKAYYTVSKGLIGFAYGNGTIYSLQE